MKTKKIIPTEADEQKVFVQWLELMGYKFSRIAQETYTPYWGQKIKNKQLGVRRGLPDLLIIVNNTLVFIEMKRKSGGAISEEQQGWCDALNHCDGVTALVCRGADEAIEFIKNST